jgi:hypothetical protein
VPPRRPRLSSRVRASRRAQLVAAMKRDQGIPAASLNRFRFQAHLHRRVRRAARVAFVRLGPVSTQMLTRVCALQIPSGMSEATVRELDLSGCGLVNGLDFERFVALQRLSLARNEITGQYLWSAKLGACTELVELDVSFNQLRELGDLKATLVHLVNLETLYMVGNPCMPKDTPQTRVQFLSKLEGIDDRSFKLASLNGAPVTIHERMEALLLNNRDAAEVETIRMELVIESRHFADDVRVVDLSNCNLQRVTGVLRFASITQLNISGNRLTDLAAQELHKLAELEVLDISNNQFKTLFDVIRALGRCHKLHTVVLHHCSADANDPQEFAPYVARVVSAALRIRTDGCARACCRLVGRRLRGVVRVDNVPNPHQLEHHQIRAAKQLAHFDIGPNCVTEIDLSRRVRAVPHARVHAS